MYLFRKSLTLILFSLATSLNLSAHFDTQEIDSLDSFYNEWDAFLANNVDASGRIDYSKLQASPIQLNRIYAYISKTSPDSHPNLFPSKTEQFTYWLNAYNIAVIYGVINHYPIKSVRDVKKLSAYSLFSGGGFFAAQKFEFGGKKMSLYKLENKLIRKRFKDPRLHFALNCASIGCPQLPQEAFKAEKLDAQLEHETKEFTQSPEKFTIDHKSKSIRISAIFDWYDTDFPNPEKANKATFLLDYIAGHLKQAQQEELTQARENGYKLQFLDYDWGLNDIK